MTRKNCNLCTFTGVPGLWLKPVGVFAGESGFGFAFVRWALAGLMAGPTFESNVLELTARSRFFLCERPSKSLWEIVDENDLVVFRGRCWKNEICCEK